MHHRFTRLIPFLVFTMTLLHGSGRARPVEKPAGTLSGYITNSETGAPIPDANILIESTPFGTASGDGGYFTLRDIPQGTYDLTVRVVGYESKTLPDVFIAGHSHRDVSLAPTVIPMNPVFVTATASDHLRSRVSVSSEVYTRQRMQQINGYSAADAVESAQGVYIKDNGGMAGLKTLSIRGSEDSHVLVLLDGTRLNSAMMGSVDINSIPMENLERIEILRGGHSALYGSDAVGGVINLITDESLPEAGRSYGLRSTLGSFGTRGINLFGSQKLGPVRLYASFNRTKSDGDFTFRHPVTESDSVRKNNDYTGNALFLKTRVRIGMRGEIHLIHNRVQSERGASGQIAWPSLRARREERRHMTSFEWRQQLAPQFRLKARTYFHRSDQRFRDPGAWTPVDSHHRNGVLGFETQSRWNLSPNVLFTAGGEFRRDRLESTDLGDQGRNTGGIYLQPEITHRIGAGRQSFLFQWFPAVRWDRFSDIPGNLNPKLGFLATVGSTISGSVRGNIGRSFRAPSFNDLYWPEDAFARGNPDLQPETGTNADIGLSLRRRKNTIFVAELTYFHHAIRDLIVWQAGPDWIWTPRNIGAVTIRGFEACLRFHLPGDRAYLRFTATRLKAVDDTEGSDNHGQQLIYRPRDKWDAAAGARLGFLRFHVNYRYVGNRRYFNYDLDVNDYDQLPAYHILSGNVGMSLRVAGFGVDVKAEVQNALDRDIIILDGYPVPGREIRISAGITY